MPTSKQFGFPVTLGVTGRRCVVIGGGSIAAEKASALEEAGAEVLAPAAGRYADDLLDGAAVVVVTGEDDTDPDAVLAAARREGALVNVMDDIPRSDFAFPSIVRRGDLQVAISTGGRAPALARRVRLHLEEALPAGIGALVDVVAEARERALPRTVAFGEWVARWRSAVDDLAGLLDLVDRGRGEEARDRIVALVSGEERPEPDRKAS